MGYTGTLLPASPAVDFRDLATRDECGIITQEAYVVGND